MILPGLEHRHYGIAPGQPERLISKVALPGLEAGSNAVGGPSCLRRGARCQAVGFRGSGFRVDDPVIKSQVISRHAPDAESIFKFLAASGAIDRANATDRGDRIRLTCGQECEPDFRHARPSLTFVHLIE